MIISTNRWMKNHEGKWVRITEKSAKEEPDGESSS